MANHRSIALRILLQPPNTFNFFVGSSNGYCGWSPRFALTSDLSLAPTKDSSDWWKITQICAEGPSGAGFSLTPLIDDPGYVNGLDSALIPLLDGLVHNISCSWFFAQTLSEEAELSSLTSPGFLIEFDFNLLD